MEKEISVDVYNQFAVLASLKDANGNPLDETNSSLGAYVRLIGSSNAASKLQSMKHSRSDVPLDPDDDNYNLVALALSQALRNSTVFVGYTHSTASAMYDSNHDVWLWTDVGSDIGSKADSPAIPAYNLVLMYACYSLQGLGATAAPGAFGVGSQSVDRAYVGFETDVMAYPFDGITVDTSRPLFAHSAKVLEDLKAGKTIKQAVDQANENHMPQDSSGMDSPAIVIGDRNSTLNRVFTGAENVPAGATWYISFL